MAKEASGQLKFFVPCSLLVKLGTGYLSVWVVGLVVCLTRKFDDLFSCILKETLNLYIYCFLFSAIYDQSLWQYKYIGRTYHETYMKSVAIYTVPLCTLQVVT